MSSTNFPLRLTVNTLVLLLLLKFYFLVAIQNKLSYLYLLSYIQDAFLFMVNYCLFVYCFSRVKVLRPVGFLFFVLFFIPISALTFTYTFFLLDLYHFPMNIFSISADSFLFFLTYFASPVSIAAFFAIYAVLFSFSYYIPKHLAYSNLIKPACLLLTFLFLPTSVRPGINPILYSLQEQVYAYLHADTNILPLVKPDDAKFHAQDFSFSNKAFDTIPLVKMNYNRIVVMVMEGLNYDTFIGQSEKNPDSFLNRFRHQIKSFTNYHTLNIDSFTSLIAMLNSIFVPYSSHTSKEHFDFTDKRNNLVRFFNQNNFTTFFITPLGTQQAYFVPDLDEWKTKMFMEGMDTVTQFKCITSMKIENSCEDLTLLQNLVDTLAAYPKIFAFNEMVYGHVNEWTEKKGMDVIEYYNQYFNLFIKKLSEKNLLDSTLVLIVSDHGPKEDALNIANYHIPLLAFATNMDTTANDLFASHLDFKNIVLELTTDTPQTFEQKPFFTYGNSVEVVYGFIQPDGGHVFINNRLRKTSGNLPNNEEVYQLNKDFQQYLHYFASLKKESNQR